MEKFVQKSCKPLYFSLTFYHLSFLFLIIVKIESNFWGIFSSNYYFFGLINILFSSQRRYTYLIKQAIAFDSSFKSDSLFKITELVSKNYMRKSFYICSFMQSSAESWIYLFFSLLSNTKVVIIHSRKMEIILQEETTSNLLGGEIKFLGGDNRKSFLYFVCHSNSTQCESGEKGR